MRVKRRIRVVRATGPEHRGAPESEPPFRIAAHILFESTETMQASFGRHSPEILGDIPNFTVIQPIVQVSEVLG